MCRYRSRRFPLRFTLLRRLPFCAELVGVGFREHMVRLCGALVNPDKPGCYLIMHDGFPEKKHPESSSGIPDS